MSETCFRIHIIVIFPAGSASTVGGEKTMFINQSDISAMRHFAEHLTLSRHRSSTGADKAVPPIQRGRDTHPFAFDKRGLVRNTGFPSWRRVVRSRASPPAGVHDPAGGCPTARLWDLELISRRQEGLFYLEKKSKKNSQDLKTVPPTYGNIRKWVNVSVVDNILTQHTVIFPKYSTSTLPQTLIFYKTHYSTVLYR